MAFDIVRALASRHSEITEAVTLSHTPHTTFLIVQFLALFALSWPFATKNL